MINRDYATRVLFALSFEDLCGYQISKHISAKDERISNGTITPILKHLLDKGMITFTVSGRKKVYTITQKGLKYVHEVRSLRNTLKKKLFVESLNENAIFLDFLSNLDDIAIFREFLEYIGDEAMSIFISGFQMQKNGDRKSLQELKELLRKISTEVDSWPLQETQN